MPSRAATVPPKQKSAEVIPPLLGRLGAIIRPTQLISALLLSLSACQPPAPDSPTWFADVQPMVMANCARCHGADPDRAEISGFRLDRYVKNDSGTLDAYDYRDAMVRSAARRELPVMPPTYALSDQQRRTLERWVEIGAPKGQRDNHPPQVERIAPAESSIVVDQSLALTIRSWDADGDGLVVRLGAREIGAPQGDALTVTGAGLRDMTLDTGLLASGRTYEVYAVLDDGYSDDPSANALEVVLLPNMLVDHGARGTAPTVRLFQPNGNETVIGSAEIAWFASDPDPGDVLTIDLELLEVGLDGSATVVANIAPGLPNDSPTFAWNTSGVPTTRGGQPISYKVRVVARDAGNKNVRSDDSDAPFTIAQQAATTAYTWADVKPVFLATCASCHGEPPALGAPSTFRLDKYDALDPGNPPNSDPGVFEMRSRVYQRLVVLETMPPVYSAPQPSAEEIAMIDNWILGGAPRGSATQDAPPTFAWTVPNNVTITTAGATGTVTLTWNASDPEGKPFQNASISYAELVAPAPQLAVCDGSIAVWTAIPGVDVTTGSYSFTVPSTGYFCFRGQVTDAAGQTTISIAQKPVKR
jgi:cytochrome c553